MNRVSALKIPVTKGIYATKIFIVEYLSISVITFPLSTCIYIATLFAVNIALKQPSDTTTKFIASKPPDYANDGALYTCFTALERKNFWFLDLGANVRVSMVFVVAYSFYNYKIYVREGESFQRFPVSSVYYSLVLLLS